MGLKKEIEEYRKELISFSKKENIEYYEYYQADNTAITIMLRKGGLSVQVFYDSESSSDDIKSLLLVSDTSDGHESSMTHTQIIPIRDVKLLILHDWS